MENTNSTPEQKQPVSILTDDDKRQINLAVRTQTTSVMNPVEYEQLRIIAKDMHESGAFPESYKNVNQILMAMQMGRSMGLSPHEAISNGYFIRGVYNVYGKAVPGALRRHGWQLQFKDETQETCTAVLTNTITKEVIEDTYNYAEAVASGYTKDNYGKEKVGWKLGMNRKRKLRYGVLSLIIHTYLPDVFGAVGGIVEFSEDYPTPENDEKRRARIAAAAKQREAMNGEPQVVDPIEADSVTMKADADAALSQEEGA
jgi:hypothetical protein